MKKQKEEEARKAKNLAEVGFSLTRPINESATLVIRHNSIYCVLQFFLLRPLVEILKISKAV